MCATTAWLFYMLITCFLSTTFFKRGYFFLIHIFDIFVEIHAVERHGFRCMSSILGESGSSIGMSVKLGDGFILVTMCTMNCVFQKEIPHLHVKDSACLRDWSQLDCTVLWCWNSRAKLPWAILTRLTIHWPPLCLTLYPFNYYVKVFGKYWFNRPVAPPPQIQS